jgi:hypothetical protein
MSNDPLRVSLTRVAEFLREIGLDPVDVKDLASVHFDPGCLTVVRHRRDESGRMLVAGGGVTRETVTIRIDDGPPVVTVKDGELHHEVQA